MRGPAGQEQSPDVDLSEDDLWDVTYKDKINKEASIKGGTQDVTLEGETTDRITKDKRNDCSIQDNSGHGSIKD